MEADLDDEAYLLEDFVDNLEDYIDALDDAIDVYERMNDARKSLAQDWKKIQRRIHF
jgi:exonuclease VII small subunit